MAELILIRGLPGSGKSTLAQKFAAIGYRHFEADMWFMRGGDVYRFNLDELKDAHNWCFEKTRYALIDGQNVVVSNTFSRVWEMQRYIDLARNETASCVFHYHNLTVLTCEGNHGNVHGVPPEIIERMAERWEPFC